MHKLLPGLVAAGALVVAAPPAVAGAAEPVGAGSHITQNGLGPIKVGTSLARAQTLTGQKIAYSPFTKGDDSCGIATLQPRSLQVTMQTTNRRIVVFNVATKGVSTPAGIEVGDRASALRAAYGAKLRSQPNKYTPKARDYSVSFGKRKLIFYADPKGVIAQISGGRTPEIDYVEGCS